MVVMFSLILLIQACLCLGSIRLQARPGQPPISTEGQGHTKVALTVSFGFDTVGGSSVYQQLLETLSEGKSMHVGVANPSELLTLHGKECALVGYLSEMEQGTGSEPFLTLIQTYVAGVIENETKTSYLVVVLEGRPGVRSERLQQRIRALTSESQLFGRNIEVMHAHGLTPSIACAHSIIKKRDFFFIS